MNNKKLLAIALSASLIFSATVDANINTKRTIPNVPFEVEENLKKENKNRKLKKCN